LQQQEFSLSGKRFLSTLTLFTLLLLSQNADAHLVSTGAGPFYDGSAHFFLTFEEILPVIALSLFAGLRGPRYGRWMVVVLPTCWIIGGALGLSKNVPLPAFITGLVMLLTGTLLAIDLKLSIKIVIGIAGFFGLLLGFLNGIAIPNGSILEIIGSATAAFLLTVLCAALAVALNHGWTRIALRVAGSWVTALGLLVLGWSMKAR
jgi:hydrogenase/urease accessory protein HupE